MKLAARYKKKTNGGFAEEGIIDAMDSVPGLGAIAKIGSTYQNTLADTIDKPDEFGRRSRLSAVVAGNAKSGTFGAIRAAVSFKNTQRKANQLEQNYLAKKRMMENETNGIMVANNPQPLQGVSSGYFAKGGKMGKYKKMAFGGDPDPTATDPVAGLTPKDMSNWNSFVGYAKSKKPDPVKLNSDSTYGYSLLDNYNKEYPKTAFDRTRVKDVQQMMLDYREDAIGKMNKVPANMRPAEYDKFGKDYAGFMPGLSKADNFPGEKTLNWKVPPHYIENKNTGVKRALGYGPALASKAMGGKLASAYNNTKAIGGTITPQSSDGALVQGQAHSKGGVKLPAKGAELEGGETMKDDYVFSKELGFADIHKPLLKSKGIIEQKPATPERINALKLIERKENELILAQEYFKKQHKIK